MVTQPVYELITKEDLIAAFRDALAAALVEILARINELIDIMTSSLPPALWTWGYASRWDYDVWW